MLQATWLESGATKICPRQLGSWALLCGLRGKRFWGPTPASCLCSRGCICSGQHGEPHCPVHNEVTGVPASPASSLEVGWAQAKPSTWFPTGCGGDSAVGSGHLTLHHCALDSSSAISSPLSSPEAAQSPFQRRRPMQRVPILLPQRASFPLLLVLLLSHLCRVTGGRRRTWSSPDVGPSQAVIPDWRA